MEEIDCRKWDTDTKTTGAITTLSFGEGELGTNVCFVLINLGIMLSTLLFLFLDETVLSLHRLYPNASDDGAASVGIQS